MVKKNNIGIKINAKPLQNKTLVSESVISDKETVSSETNNISTSTSNTTDTKSNNIGNSLSLLGAYSGSSDDDSS